MTAPLLLVLGDHEPLTRSLTIALRSQGYRVDSGRQQCVLTHTTDRTESTDLADTTGPGTQPALVLLELGSHEAPAHVLAALQRSTCAPVLVLSGRHEDAHRRLTLAAGAADFLPMPFTMDELQQRIEGLLPVAAKLLPVT